MANRAITVEQLSAETSIILEETAVEVFGSVEAFVDAYNAEVDR
jgi:hypothetical protein